MATYIIKEETQTAKEYRFSSKFAKEVKIQLTEAEKKDLEERGIKLKPRGKVVYGENNLFIGRCLGMKYR